MPENEDLDAHKKKLEIKKLEGEIKKIDAEYEKITDEHKELTKSWFKRPAWWSAIIPLVIGAGTIYIAFSSGIISVERLKNEKEALDKTIATMNKSVTKAEKDKQALYDTLIIMKNGVGDAEKVKQALTDTLGLTKGEVKQAQEELKSMAANIAFTRQKLDQINDTIAKEYAPNRVRVFFANIKKAKIYGRYTNNATDHDAMLDDLETAFMVAFEDVNRKNREMVDALFRQAQKKKR